MCFEVVAEGDLLYECRDEQRQLPSLVLEGEEVDLGDMWEIHRGSDACRPLVLEGEEVDRVVQLARDVRQVVDERRVRERPRRRRERLHHALPIRARMLAVEEGEKALEGLEDKESAEG